MLSSSFFESDLDVQQTHLKSFCPGNTNLRGRFGTVDLLSKLACFIKHLKIFSSKKVADLN